VPIAAALPCDRLGRPTLTWAHVGVRSATNYSSSARAIRRRSIVDISGRSRAGRCSAWRNQEALTDCHEAIESLSWRRSKGLSF
jgi:hypothetical protein